jgi:hypothetical protein
MRLRILTEIFLLFCVFAGGCENDYGQSEVKGFTDYEAEARTQINSDNMEAELDRLEAVIESELSLEP